MKVLHISGARGWGGNEQQMIDFIPELQKLGVENIVFGVENSVLHRQCTEKGITFIISKKNKLNKIANYFYLKTIVNKVKPHVIHLHTSDSLTVFTISDMLTGLRTKAVFSKKGMGSSSSLLSKFKYNYKNIGRIICVSDAVKQSFKSTLSFKNQPKLAVVYDGINLDRVAVKNNQDIRSLFGIDKSKKVVGNIANHVKAKDLPVLIKSINHLVHVLNYKEIHLLQIGSFSEKYTPEIQQLIKELQLEEYITLANFQDNASGFLPQFDLYVMSSEREGLPLTIYEAFLNRIPVVSTKAGGIPEAITHGENGYLAEVKDHESLAKYMKEVLTDDAKSSIFAEKAYALFMEKYTAQQTALNTLAIYKQLQ